MVASNDKRRARAFDAGATKPWFESLAFRIDRSEVVMHGIEGLHHVTAIAGEPQTNINFYGKLRLPRASESVPVGAEDRADQFLPMNKRLDSRFYHRTEIVRLRASGGADRSSIPPRCWRSPRAKVYVRLVLRFLRCLSSYLALSPAFGRELAVNHPARFAWLNGKSDSNRPKARETVPVNHQNMKRLRGIRIRTR
jgi:hypothetical protein